MVKNLRCLNIIFLDFYSPLNILRIFLRKKNNLMGNVHWTYIVYYYVVYTLHCTCQGVMNKHINKATLETWETQALPGSQGAAAGRGDRPGQASTSIPVLHCNSGLSSVYSLPSILLITVTVVKSTVYQREDVLFF